MNKPKNEDPCPPEKARTDRSLGGAKDEPDGRNDSGPNPEVHNQELPPQEK